VSYTPETWDAIRIADRRYTRAFGAAMAAFGRQDGLAAARDAYNAIMGPAHATWRTECRNAVALSEGAEF
jgi:hypothetical protein